jgi:hypothetical protein
MSISKCPRCGADLNTTGDCPNCGQLVIYSDLEGTEIGRGFLTGKIVSENGAEEEHAHIWQKTMDLKSIYSTIDTDGGFFSYRVIAGIQQRHICSCGAEKWEAV